MQNPLHKLKIYILDADQELATVFRGMLKSMGFLQIFSTPSGKQALHMMEETPPDFIIMDWNVKEIDSVELIERVRHNPFNPTLPIIMFSGRTERSDILLARDKGVNEYMAKPFTAKTAYEKLERLVESPRQFVVSRNYVGPDRRVRKQSPPDGRETRTHQLHTERRPAEFGQHAPSGATPKLWFPDFSIKRKIGDIPFESIITPTVLNQAQATVNAAIGESTQWIKKDIEHLYALHKALAGEASARNAAEEMKEMVLAVRSRAGTFGYSNASEVAYMLYLFCRNDLNISNKKHIDIIEKFIQTLQVIFASSLDDYNAKLPEVIVALKVLTEKYR